MLTAIFPDSCASINRNEYLLCVNRSTVIRHYEILHKRLKQIDRTSIGVMSQ